MAKLILILSMSFFVIFPLTVYAKLQLFMAGDSTMAIKDPKDYPETGWGVPFATFFSDNLEVINLAKNGRSTRTFIEEGLWENVQNQAKRKDFLIIQFGHNDESVAKKDRFTTPQEYKTNLRNMVTFALERKMSVILMTPVTRRYFDEAGAIKETHAYSQYVRELVESYKNLDKSDFLFIDMDEITRRYFQAQGEIPSQLRFMYIKPDTHPNYPYGVKDNTHFNELGAREVAQLVLTELKTVRHPLSSLLRDVDPKHIKLSY